MTERLKKTGAEKIARKMHNLGDTGVKHFYMGSEESAEKQISLEQASKFEQEANDYAEKFKAYESELSRTAEDLSQHKNLQIKPIANYVIVKPFKVNPFQQITKSAAGIITNIGGNNPIIKSSDSGEYEEEEQYIFQATVVEVGPECKWLKVGDIIMYNKPSTIPIPFYKLGFELVNETRALCVINDDLNERF